MSDFRATKTVNWVYTTIRAACVSGGTLSYVKPENVLLGAHHDLKNLNKRFPVIQVAKQRPTARAESWGYVANDAERCDLLLRVRLGFEPPNLSWPYGYWDEDESKRLRGWDTFVDDVMNTIETAPNGKTLGGNVVNGKLTVSDEDVVNELYIGDIEIAAWLDFPFGQR